MVAGRGRVMETEMGRAYFIGPRDDDDGDCEYSVLCGPNGWECFLGEPEDCRWERDGRPAIKELNRLADGLAAADAVNTLLLGIAAAVAELVDGGMPNGHEVCEGVDCAYCQRIAAIFDAWDKANAGRDGWLRARIREVGDG